MNRKVSFTVFSALIFLVSIQFVGTVQANVTITPDVYFKLSAYDTYINFNTARTFSTITVTPTEAQFDDYKIQIENVNVTVTTWFTDTDFDKQIQMNLAVISTPATVKINPASWDEPYYIKIDGIEYEEGENWNWETPYVVVTISETATTLLISWKPSPTGTPGERTVSVIFYVCDINKYPIPGANVTITDIYDYIIKKDMLTSDTGETETIKLETTRKYKIYVTYRGIDRLVEIQPTTSGTIEIELNINLRGWIPETFFGHIYAWMPYIIMVLIVGLLVIPPMLKREEEEKEWMPEPVEVPRKKFKAEAVKPPEFAIKAKKISRKGFKPIKKAVKRIKTKAKTVTREDFKAKAKQVEKKLWGVKPEVKEKTWKVKIKIDKERWKGKKPKVTKKDFGARAKKKKKDFGVKAKKTKKKAWSVKANKSKGKKQWRAKK